MIHKIELKTAPDVKKVVLAAFPSYKKHNVFLSESTGGINVNSFWDGGSRSEFAIVELATMQRKQLPTRTHPYFDVAAHGLTNAENDVVAVDHVGNVTLKQLPAGYVVVEAGTFCGKPATAHIYVNPENLVKLLPA